MVRSASMYALMIPCLIIVLLFQVFLTILASSPSAYGWSLLMCLGHECALFLTSDARWAFIMEGEVARGARGGGGSNLFTKIYNACKSETFTPH